MTDRSGRLRALAVVLLSVAPLCAAAATRELRVCADPNNLPFSNRNEQGFENRIAHLLADELHARVEYTWWAQRRGFARNTVRADKCDLWIGVASGVQTLETTAPYYRSAYVFVTRADRRLDIRSFDDPRLRSLTLGVQMIGNDSSNTPPAHALARRGIVDNVRGFMIYGNYADPDPAAPIVTAVADGSIDVAVVWGPVAGYFAARAKTPLRIEPVEPQSDGPSWPMAFDIAVGVRRGDVQLRRDVEQALARRRDAIARVLDDFNVPRVAPAPMQSAADVARAR